MIVQAQAPTRISLFGGGSDIAPYCDLYGGLVINLAINLRSKFTLFTGDDMYGPQANNIIPYLGKKEFVYTFLKEFDLGDMHRARFNSSFEALLEAGLGSSASAAVTIIGAINKLKNLNLTLDQIAKKAWEIEVNKLGLFGGQQDQYVSVYGGVNVMEFKVGGGVNVHQLARGFIEPLLPSLMLFYTGKNRKSAIIQEGFKELDEDQIKALHRIKYLAKEAIDPIGKGDFRVTGALLDEAWEWKKLSNKGVSNTRIEGLYKTAMENGALGFKCCGAGGGGYILCICSPKDQPQLKSALEEKGCTWWDFGIDWNGLEVRDITDK